MTSSSIFPSLLDLIYFNSFILPRKKGSFKQELAPRMIVEIMNWNCYVGS